MWGCIAQNARYRAQRHTPSLYVRVYRREKPTAGKTASSLIICEGVSSASYTYGAHNLLPHYMWGCIGVLAFLSLLSRAPSLYVRVYRPYSLHQICRWRSLIICEGVSELKKCYEQLQDAPSLYVRVYRPPKKHTPHIRSSLIICEGVSQRKSTTGWTFQLHHYMWGCIPCMKSAGGMALVPSLYVRVYRLCGSAFSLNSSSLTIREGVSVEPLTLDVFTTFPHYTWGCII